MTLSDKNRSKVPDFLDYHRERIMRKNSVVMSDEYEIEEEEGLYVESEPEKKRGKRIDNVNLFLPNFIQKRA